MGVATQNYEKVAYAWANLNKKDNSQLILFIYFIFRIMIDMTALKIK